MCGALPSACSRRSRSRTSCWSWCTNSCGHGSSDGATTPRRAAIMPVAARPTGHRGCRVNDEHAHVALPKLYGAPAYARPPVLPVAPVERPFDPDDLPLEAERPPEEAKLASELKAHPYTAVASSDPGRGSGTGHLRARAFRLRIPGRS